MRFFVLALLAAAGVGTVVMFSPRAHEPSDIPGQSHTSKLADEQRPRKGCQLISGYEVCDSGQAEILSSYLRFQDFSGEPVSESDARCQTFRFSKLCFNPGNPDGWKVEYFNLGLQDMQAEGFTPQPGSSPHPAVRDWLISQMEVGLDTTRVVGRIISPPICDSKTGQCKQWADKALFLYTQDALAGSQVQRAPLGLRSIHPVAPTNTETISDSHNPNLPLPLLGVGAVVGLGVLVFIVARPGSTSSGSAI